MAKSWSAFIRRIATEDRLDGADLLEEEVPVERRQEGGG